MKTQFSAIIISANFKILHFLSKGVVWALKGAKLIFGEQTLFIGEIL